MDGRVAALVGTLLVACGGGGGGNSDGGSSGPNEAQGFYIGGADGNSRASYGVVLSNGDTWVLYSAQGDDVTIAGFARAQMTITSSGHFSWKGGRDYNLEGLGVNGFTGSGTYVVQSSLEGMVNFSGGSSLDVNGSYDDGYNDAPTVATIQGNYAIQASTPEVSDTGSLQVSSTGALSGGSSSYDCTYTGQATPRADGNVYDVRVTFSGSECAAPGETIRGIAFYNAGTAQLIGAAVLSDKSSGAVFAGHKV